MSPTSNTISLKILDTDKIIFEGQVNRISSYNDVGPFDIYHMHANFISIIKKEVLLFSQDKLLKKLKIDQAILKIKKDVAEIFLGIDTLMVKEEEGIKQVEKI